MSTGLSMKEFLDATASRPVLLALVLVFCFATYLVVYRLYLGPLAHIPGPKIAALTALYAIYHDVIRGGQYIWIVEEMHKQYGPIVRIRPDTVHINDARYLDQVYGVGGKRRNKSQLHCNALMTPGAFVSTSDHDLHRSRRGAMAPFFSKQSIRRLEPILHRCLDRILDRFDEHAVAQTPINLGLLFTAATSDITTEYAFGNCWNCLDVPDFDEQFFRTLRRGALMWHVSSYVPWVMSFLISLPESISTWLMPDMKVLIPHFAALKRQIEDIRSSRRDGSLSVFQGILDSKLPESEKELERLFSEASVIIAAGTEATATMLTNITFHLLQNPNIIKKLKAELEIAIPDANSVPTASQVENLPYLNAIIQETLRLHPGGSMRQERFAPDEDIVYENDNGRKYNIPRGTSMAMTAPLLSRNETLYPSSNEWLPQRFLDNPHLDKFLLTWSHGTRKCLGINLAYLELRILLSGIFRKYDLYDTSGVVGEWKRGPTLQLFETGREDVDMVSDFAMPFVRRESKGVRVMVRN